MPIVGMILASVVGAMISGAMAPGMPDAANYAEASKEGIWTDLETLPTRRKIERAAQLGIPVEYDLPRATTVTVRQPVVQVGHHDPLISMSGYVPYNSADWEEGGKYYGRTLPPIEYRNLEMTLPSGKHKVDFTGLGQADIQAAVARDTAGRLLEIQKEFGPQFIEESLAELKAADPEGWEARKALYETIQKDVESAKTAQRPVADELERQMTAEMQTPTGQYGPQVRQQALNMAAQVAGSRGASATGEELTVAGESGLPAEQREAQRAQAAMGYLTSGVSPEDVAYRRRQQSFANLGAYLSGQTPQAQFASLSGAQQGATPFTTGAALPTVNQNAAAQSVGFTQQAYNTQLQNAMNQANPWLAGIGLAIKGANVYGAATQTGG